MKKQANQNIMRGTPIHQGRSYRQPQPLQRDTEDDVDGSDEMWPPRPPSSTRKYNVPITDEPPVFRQGNRQYIVHDGLPSQMPKRASREPIPQQPVHEHEPSTTGNRFSFRAHWLLEGGLMMLAMVALWWGIVWVMNWWQVTQDDWHYGRPRTYQVDAVVGHGDSPTHPSHFIAINLNRQIDVFECPAGNCTKAVIYVGPQLFGDGTDLTPVTLELKDVNGDGKPDMLLHIANQTYVFLNDGGKFRSANANDRIAS